MSIQLLLTDLRSLAPVLGRLPSQSVVDAPKPAQRLPRHLAIPGHSNDLAAEQWGVIAPATAAGDQMLQWIRPLCDLRKRQCGLASGAELRVWREPAGMTSQQARAWRAAYERIPAGERPGYLLILGDLHEISLELQQELMVSAAVGRLCFTDAEGQPDRAGYEAYCAKVCDLEARRAEWSAGARLLLYAAHDGSVSSQEGYYDLIRECYRDARAEKDALLARMDLQLFGRSDDHEWHTDDADPPARARTLLHHAQMSDPAVLMSLTHGLAVSDPAERPAHQGALILGEVAGRRRTEVLGQTFFAQRFLPGGFWFIKACFGAGTPAASVYEPWLACLHELGGYAGDPRDALAYLASPPSRPFIARVPQVALAHREGPLGVVGHVDLAWTYGYQGVDEANPRDTRAEPGPYYDVLRMVLCGHRLGAAVASLSDKAQQIGTHLASLYGSAAIGGGGAEQQLLRSWLWMRYLDLSGYILLGDPACQTPTGAARVLGEPPRLGTAGTAGTAGTTGTAGTAPPVVGQSVERMEEAVLACLRQRKPPGEIAREAGIHPTTLERWLRIYKDAGRRALAEAGGAGDGEGDEP
jgi:hypothetical protein